MQPILRLALVFAAVALGSGGSRAGPSLPQALDADGAGRRCAPARITVALADAPALALPHFVAPAASSRRSLGVLACVHDAPRWRVGVQLRNGATRRLVGFEGSDWSWRLDASELYASVERRHWGPGHAGSLILDGAAEPVPALGWRRAAAVTSESAWLAWLGPWRGDVFVGALTGHREPERPWLIGMRIEAKPWPLLVVGASRTLQWGGRGRPQTPLSLLRALVGSDNAGYDGVSADNEPGNQLAGIDWRVTLAPDKDIGWYGQVVGEDEAGKLPSRNFALSGVEARWPLAPGMLRLFVEWTNTTAGSLGGDERRGATYRHHVYRQGYTHDGAPLGHPIGGDVELAAAGLRFTRGAFGGTLVAARGRALPTAQRWAPGPIEAINAALQLDLGPRTRTGAHLAWLRDAQARRGSVQWWWQHAWP